VNALIANEAIRTGILLMIELRKVEFLRGELKFCGSMFYCTRVDPSTTVVAPAEPWLSGGSLTTVGIQPSRADASPSNREARLEFGAMMFCLLQWGA
jgi:hypothetical protein